MAFDIEYTVRLAETLRPYRLKWMEECLLSEDLDGHVEVRERIPWQTLSTGEHWYTHMPFQWALRHNVVDILQPDINWVGGLSTCLKIANAADAAGKKVILHGGGRNPFGQHFTHAIACVPWLEYFIGSAPGRTIGRVCGHSRAGCGRGRLAGAHRCAGFGLEIQEDWIEPYF